MRRFLLITLASAALIGCDSKPATQAEKFSVESPSAPELWGGASYGMSPAQVKATSDEVVDSTLPLDTLHNGAVQLLERQNLVIANTNFKAQYFFIGEKLHQVTLGLNEKKIYAEAERAAAQIKDALTAKYEYPLSCAPFSGGLSKGYTCNWKRPDGNVLLFLNAIDETRPILNIVYQVRLAQDAKNL